MPNRGDAPLAVWNLLQDLPKALATLPSADLGTLAGEEAELTVGTPREVFRWNSRPTAGDTSTVLVPADSWLAPLNHEGKLVGALLVSVPREGNPKVAEVWDDAELAKAFTRAPSKAQLVYGAGETGWYQVVDGEVSAVDAAARDLLVGSVPLEDFPEIQATVEAHAKENGTTNPQTPPKQVEKESAWRFPVMVGGIVLVVLLLVVLLTWLLRPEPPEDEEPRAPLGMLLLRRPATSKPSKIEKEDGAERARKLPR